MQYILKPRADGKQGLFIDKGDIDIPELEGKEDVLLSFSISTYTKMSGKNAEEEASFGAINNFFDYISKEDKKIILIYLANMHHIIREYIGSGKMENIVDMSKELGAMLLSLNNTIQLYDKLTAFADGNIPINIMAGAGTRAQDTKLHTYLYQDTVELMGCVLLSKLMLPVFGAIMHYTAMYDVEANIKEMHCLPIVTPTFRAACPHVIYKFKEYIKPIVAKEFTNIITRNKKDEVATINIGLTTNTITTQAFVRAVVRNFINIDVYRKSGNHIMALRVNIKSNITSHLNDIKKHRVSVREDQNNAPGDQQRSQLEIDSIISSSTSDIAVLAESYIDKTCTRFLKEYSLDRKLYETIWQHNLNTQVTPNSINKLALEVIFNRALSGVNSLSYLRIEAMSKLIAIAQLICFSLNLNELAHAMTSVDSTNIKGTIDIIDQKIVLQYMNAPYYVNYINKLQESSIGGDVLLELFKTRIVSIVTDITSKYYLCNTAQIIYDKIEETNVNGNNLQFTEEFINEYCYLLYTMWPEQDALV